MSYEHMNRLGSPEEIHVNVSALVLWGIHTALMTLILVIILIEYGFSEPAIGSILAMFFFTLLGLFGIVFAIIRGSSSVLVAVIDVISVLFVASFENADLSDIVTIIYLTGISVLIIVRSIYRRVTVFLEGY